MVHQLYKTICNTATCYYIWNTHLDIKLICQ